MRHLAIALLVACGSGHAGPDADLTALEPCKYLSGLTCEAACNQPQAKPGSPGTGAPHCLIGPDVPPTDCEPDFYLNGVRVCCWSSAGVIKPIPCS